MKSFLIPSILVLATTSSSSHAFVTQQSTTSMTSSITSSSSSSSSSSRMSLDMTASSPDNDTGGIIAATATKPTTLTEPKLAGDYGFDPLSFAKNKEALYYYREMEMKHARLAMLAAAGWPMSELLDRPIAEFYGLPSLLDDATNRAPSFLGHSSSNIAGLERVAPQFWGFCVGLTAAIESYAIHRSRTAVDGDSSRYTPGDLGWDPLSLGKNKKDVQEGKLAEIQNGRLAMLGVTGFAAQEYVDGTAVVDETPFFFQPLTETLERMLVLLQQP